MSVQITVSDDALDLLRPLFSSVEGNCEVWTDDEVVTRMLIRGVLAYGQTAGRLFADMSKMAAQLRDNMSTTPKEG